MTPPRDRIFLADVGLPYYVTSIYSPVDDYYVFAELQVDLYNGKWEDVYFQTERFKESEIKSWIEFPTKGV